MSSYQSEITANTPRINAVRSSDIGQVVTSGSSYQAEWNFTHSNLEHSYIAYSETSSRIQTILVRKDSSSLFPQRTRSSASPVTTKHLQSSRYELRSTVSSNRFLSHTVSRPLNVSVVFSTRTVRTDRNYSTVLTKDSISPRLNTESKTVMLTVNFEGEHPATSTFHNPWVFSTDVLSPSASRVVLASSLPSTGE